MHTLSVLDDSDQLTNNTEDLRKCWQSHFTRVLNVSSKFDAMVVNSMSSYTSHHDLDLPPSIEEVVSAVRKMNGGTAGGQSGLVPEMLMHGGRAILDRVHALFSQVWERGSVVSDWRDAEIVPIPKKGDLRIRDNWRGISLLDVVRKLFAQIIQDRLQIIPESVLPDWQCGSAREGDVLT